MMDTSTEYLKMCDCPEIQDFRKEYGQWQDGDFAADKAAPRDISFHCSECDHEYGAEFQLDCIWLPRQDQLQEMLGSSLCTDSPVTAWLDKLWPFYKAHHHEACWMTWEQFWLCFVMRVLHKKCWDGKGWVNAAP